MNNISPMLPVVEPVPDDEGGRLRIEPDTSVLDEEPVPEGVALLLAAFEQPPRTERRPGALPMASTGQHVNLERRPGTAVEAPSIADSPVAPRSAVKTAQGLSIEATETVRIGGQAPERPGTPVQDMAVEEGSVGAVDEGPVPVEAAHEEPVPRVAGEFFQGIPQPRLEALAPLAQVFSDAMADEQAAMSGQREDASPQWPDQDDEASGDFLQVPFHNERARGQVLVSREESGQRRLLIRATDRQVFEQLQGHFDQARQPRWRLDDDGAGSA